MKLGLSFCHFWVISSFISKAAVSLSWCIWQAKSNSPVLSTKAVPASNSYRFMGCKRWLWVWGNIMLSHPKSRSGISFLKYFSYVYQLSNNINKETFENPIPWKLNSRQQYIHINIHTHTHTHTHIYIYIYICTHAHTHPHTHTHTHIYIFMYLYIQEYIYIYTYRTIVYIYLYISINMYI